MFWEQTFKLFAPSESAWHWVASSFFLLGFAAGSQSWSWSACSVLGKMDRSSQLNPSFCLNWSVVLETLIDVFLPKRSVKRTWACPFRTGRIPRATGQLQQPAFLAHRQQISWFMVRHGAPLVLPHWARQCRETGQGEMSEAAKNEPRLAVPT